MIRWIIRRFIENHQDVTNKDVRESYGVLAGVLGIACNVLLFAVKIAVGLVTNSIAVTSDAFNNLSDTGSSIVAIFGAKMSNRPADDEHPHGHGRFEYVASLAVSFIILVVGVQLLSTSFRRLTNSEEVLFDPLSAALLTLSILVKLWMFSYNRHVGVLIGSQVNRAAAIDSLNDSVATGAVIAGSLFGKYTTFPIDGVLGLIISCLIIYTGFSTAKESVNSLLGSHDPGLIDRINAHVLKGRSIKGVHDLRIHDYGPGRIVASIHAEVSADANIVDIHEEIDSIEKSAESELGVTLVIHMDPAEVAPEVHDCPSH